MGSNGEQIGSMSSRRRWIAAAVLGVAVSAAVGVRAWLPGYQERALFAAQVDKIRDVIQAARGEILLTRDDCIADLVDFPDKSLIHANCQSFLRDEIRQADRIIAFQQLELKRLGQKPEPVYCIAQTPGFIFDMKLLGCIEK